MYNKIKIIISVDSSQAKHNIKYTDKSECMYVCIIGLFSAKNKTNTFFRLFFGDWC